MRKTIVICDLEHDDVAPAVATLVIVGDTRSRQVDVCRDHKEWFESLGQPHASTSTG